MKWGWGRKKWIVTSCEADLELPTATVLHATGKKILWSDKDLQGAVLHMVNTVDFTASIGH